MPKKDRIDRLRRDPRVRYFKGLFGRTTGLQLQFPVLQLSNVSIAFIVAFADERPFGLHELLTGCHIDQTDRKASIHWRTVRSTRIITRRLLR